MVGDAHSTRLTMHHQPDFSTLFRSHFAAVEPRVTYEIRYHGPNALHDVAFISSLIHDAQFRPRDVVLSGGNLTIALDRDCWERYDPGAPRPVLPVCQAAIRATHVVRVTWDGGFSPDETLCVDHLWLDESFQFHDDSPIKVILAGDSWRVTIEMDREDSAFVLTDLTDPA